MSWCAGGGGGEILLHWHDFGQNFGISQACLRYFVKGKEEGTVKGKNVECSSIYIREKKTSQGLQKFRSKTC